MADRYWLNQTPAVEVAVAGFAVTPNNPAYNFASSTLSRYKRWMTALPSTLRHLISNIIFVSAKKQVSRVYADRVIAFVQHVQSFIKFTVLKFVTNTVRGSVLTIKPKLTVKTRLATSSFTKPLPAFMLSPLINLRPVSSFVGLFHRYSIAQNLGGLHG